MWSFIGTIFGVGLMYLVSLTVSTLVVVAMRWLLVALFEDLDEGFARRTIAYPIVALLGRERKARRGDSQSLYELVLSLLAVTALVSLVLQGVLSTLICTAIAAGASALAIFRS